MGPGIALTVAGICQSLGGDVDEARTSYSDALADQERLGDREGAGMSLGGLAGLASGDGDVVTAIDLYGRSLEAFETIGDRGEEARILSEMAWTHLRTHETARARRYFFESVQAHTDLASVRGVGLSLIGLAATEAVDLRPDRAVESRPRPRCMPPRRASSSSTPTTIRVVSSWSGRAHHSRRWTSPGPRRRGRRLTINQALELARIADAAPAAS